MRRYRSVGLRPPLPQRTLDYLANGADEGRRNAELFDASCQFRDAGFTFDEAEAQLVARATLDGLSEAEARTAIRSAFTHTPREPATCHAPAPLPVPNGTPRPEPKPPREAPPLSPVALPDAMSSFYLRAFVHRGSRTIFVGHFSRQAAVGAKSEAKGSLAFVASFAAVADPGAVFARLSAVAASHVAPRRGP